ncbi:pyridoxine/pyridoxamine 5'-phosphate oxidase [Saccharibacillus sacchari]|uniref:pyridoxine/pyridoxamine 5'-phosphate oxidase n=1 Tax=Saccharibacillus sacchari TaxID=456493 RepID=UPI0004B79874|nr:pyridoxal 5'-phosphate synthase [Saccharibacillus sacchari]
MSDTKKDNRNPLFRGLKSLTGSFDTFRTEHLPEKPGELFLQWFEDALRRQVTEPHAVTLSTVDGQGRPDARTLILKDVHGETFYFASSIESRKGMQLQEKPYAALTFYWPAVGRQIRLRGTAAETGEEEGADDFRRRPDEARAVAMIGRQSRPLDSREELEAKLTEQRGFLENHPEAAAPLWRLYALEIDEAEFWQADPGRKHTRVQYRLNEQGDWESGLLWP